MKEAKQFLTRVGRVGGGKVWGTTNVLLTSPTPVHSNPKSTPPCVIFCTSFPASVPAMTVCVAPHCTARSILSCWRSTAMMVVAPAALHTPGRAYS